MWKYGFHFNNHKIQRIQWANEWASVDGWRKMFVTGTNLNCNWFNHRWYDASALSVRILHFVNFRWSHDLIRINCVRVSQDELCLLRRTSSDNQSDFASKADSHISRISNTCSESFFCPLHSDSTSCHLDFYLMSLLLILLVAKPSWYWRWFWLIQPPHALTHTHTFRLAMWCIYDENYSMDLIEWIKSNKGFVKKFIVTNQPTKKKTESWIMNGWMQ